MKRLDNVSDDTAAEDSARPSMRRPPMRGEDAPSNPATKLPSSASERTLLPLRHRNIRSRKRPEFDRRPIRLLYPRPALRRRTDRSNTRRSDPHAQYLMKRFSNVSDRTAAEDSAPKPSTRRPPVRGEDAPSRCEVYSRGWLHLVDGYISYVVIEAPCLVRGVYSAPWLDGRSHRPPGSGALSLSPSPHARGKPVLLKDSR